MSIKTPESANVCAVLVTYNPPPAFAANLAALAKQVGAIVVVDNDSTPATQQTLQQACEVHHAQLLRNENNLGIATALNSGIREAIRKGFNFVVTMDQDTTAEDDMVSLLSGAYSACPHAQEVAVVGISYPGMTRNNRIDIERGARPYETVKTVITAGCLIPLPAFERLSGFREDLFIDGVDEDFCLRARRAGFVVLRAVEVGIHQAIGMQTRRRFLWREVGVSNHSALRHYYMTRNRWILIANHFMFDPVWAASQILTQVKMVAFVLLFEDNKGAKLGAMLRGFAHAILGKRGKLDDARLA